MNCGIVADLSFTAMFDCSAVSAIPATALPGTGCAPPAAVNCVTHTCQLRGVPLIIRAAGPGTGQELQREADKAAELAGFVYRLMNPLDGDSDLSRLNRCAHIAPLCIHPWTWHTLSCAIALSRETGGSFDITVEPHLVKGGPEARHQAAKMLKEAARWEDIELLPGHQVRFRSRLTLDLRGLVYACVTDRVLNHLSTRHEIRSASVQCGPWRRTCGSPWPAKTEPEKALPMLRPAMTTQPGWLARTAGGMRRALPVLHPQSGRLLRTNRSLSVFSATCVEAAGLARAILSAPQSLWNRLLHAHDSVALLLTRHGEQVLFPS
jgi:FAD:protein FMN transferase